MPKGITTLIPWCCRDENWLALFYWCSKHELVSHGKPTNQSPPPKRSWDSTGLQAGPLQSQRKLRTQSTLRRLPYKAPPGHLLGKASPRAPPQKSSAPASRAAIIILRACKKLWLGHNTEDKEKRGSQHGGMFKNNPKHIETYFCDLVCNGQS